MASIVTGARRAPLSDRGHDLYETPSVAVDALVAAEGNRLPMRVWEPACGPGAIVRALEAHGREVYGTDLIDYGTPEQRLFGVDFLQTPPGLSGDAIVTNPPYKLAAEFVATARQRAPYVAMLLRLAFLEGEKRGRTTFAEPGLARVHVFSRRLPMMHRAGWVGPKSTSATAFAWFVWERSHKAPPTINWIDWKALEGNQGAQP